MIRFIPDESRLTPEFLFAYTQSSIYTNWVKAIQRAAGQPNINAEEYKSLLIALPPVDVQTEIAKHVNEMRNQVETLRSIAKNDFGVVKSKIEQMILKN
jgi:restriction endonuclease S subunit